MRNHKGDSIILRFTVGGFILGLFLYFAHNMPFWRQSRYFWLIILIVLTSFSYLLGRYVTRVNNSLERDFLTNLYNENSFHEYLSLKINAGDVFYLLVLDIDRFKEINDLQGHLVGDQILVNFAMLLQSCFGKIGRVFRWGGDEFVMIIDCLEREELEKNLREFIVIQKKTLNISSSMGISRWQQGMEELVLFSQADQALYQAKKENKRYVFADREE